MRQRNPERVRVWRDRINAFCRERKLTRSNFDPWRRILTPENSRPPRGPAPAFVPMRLAAEPVAEVVLPSGVIVRLPVSSGRRSGTHGTCGRPWSVNLGDVRFGIDNVAAERAIRPIGGGGLTTASIWLGSCTSARLNRMNPWTYMTDGPSAMSAPSAREGSDLLPDRMTGA